LRAPSTAARLPRRLPLLLGLPYFSCIYRPFTCAGSDSVFTTRSMVANQPLGIDSLGGHRVGGVATEGGASATVAKTAMAARCARAPLRTPGRVCPRLRASLPVALPDHTLVLGSAGRGARQRQPSSKAADALEGTAVGAKRNAGCDVGGISLSSASAGSSRAADNARERENKRPRNAEEPVVAAAPDAAEAVAADLAAETSQPKVISPPHEPNSNTYTSTS
jgi:hypothetical protein